MEDSDSRSNIAEKSIVNTISKSLNKFGLYKITKIILGVLVVVGFFLVYRVMGESNVNEKDTEDN